MKLLLPGIHSALNIRKDAINSLVMEKPSLLYDVVYDIKCQTEKKDGESVLSFNNEVLKIYDEVHLMTDIYSVDLNSKVIVAKIADNIGKKAADVAYYERAMQIAAELQAYISDIAWELDYEIECADIAPKQLIKAVGLTVLDDSVTVAERLFSYVELIRRLLGDKLFVFVNFRGYIEKIDFAMLAETLINHEYRVLFIDNKEYPRVANENRLTVDGDLCEF